MNLRVCHAAIVCLLLSCPSWAGPQPAQPSAAQPSAAQPGAAQPGAAQQPCQQDSADCREVGRWEFSVAIGAGARSNPLVEGDAQPLVLVPQFSWYGERLFVDNFELGFTLLDRPRHMLNLLLTPGFDKFFFDDGLGFGNFIIEDSSLVSGGGDHAGAPDGEPVPTQRVQQVDPKKVDERRLAMLAGLEYGLYLKQWLLSAQLLGDATGVHNGKELRLALGWQGKLGDNTLSASVGAVWQSRQLLDYYYGLDQHEVNNQDLLFRGESDWSPVVKVQWRRRLSESWSFYSTLHYKRFGSHTADSPLLEDDYVVTGFIGGIYHF